MVRSMNCQMLITKITSITLHYKDHDKESELSYVNDKFTSITFYYKGQGKQLDNNQNYQHNLNYQHYIAL